MTLRRPEKFKLGWALMVSDVHEILVNMLRSTHKQSIEPYLFLNMRGCHNNHTQRFVIQSRKMIDGI